MDLKILLSKSKKIVLGCTAAFFLSAYASQCFAESPSPSATKQKNATKQYLELFGSLFDFVQRNYVDEVEAEKLYRGALKGMMDSLGDPYSVYLETDTLRSLTDTTTGTFGGIGATISKPIDSTPDKPAYVEIQSAVEDTPAYKAGLQNGDLILSVDGNDTSKITMEEVLGKLRGKVGEDVVIEIRRGKNMEFPVTLTRALIEVPCEKHAMIGKTGYVRLIEFTPLTAEKLQIALDDFKKNGFDSLIIDLRNNPGGLITSAVDICDKFIDEGPIVSTKSRIMFQNSIYTASARKTTVKNIPIIVLINGGSASASEIVSGALKDNHLAYLVGTKSYGKGSVQQMLPLSEKDGIKMTMARYYTPSDTNIDKIGIPPDREVKFPELGEDGEKQYTEILKEEVVQKFVEEKGEMTLDEITNAAKDFNKKYSAIDERTFRRLIRNELNKKKSAPVYDLDYDIQLNAALDILKNENFSELMKNTKTLKELQAEREAEKAETEADKK